MVKYHFNGETGRVNICRAVKGKCPLGADAPHFNTKEEANAYVESEAKNGNETFNTLTKVREKPFKPSFKNVKSKEETLRMIRNWKTGEYTRKQLDQMDLEYIEVDTSYGSYNATISLTNDDTHAFLYGACLSWAYEAHLQHGGDFVVWTINPGEKNWEGHVALDLGNGECFDCEGSSPYQEGDSNFMSYKAKCEKMSPEDFIKKFEMEDAVKTYNNIGRYMLGYKVNDLLKDEGLL